MPAEREKLRSDELAVVLSHYDVGIIQEAREFPRGSHAAAKVFVRTDRGSFMLKRRPLGQADVFRVAFSHDLQRHLASKHFPLPHLIGTRGDNNSMLKIGGAIYELYEYIEGLPFDHSLVATYEAGRTLAIYHHLLRDYQPKYPPPVGSYHDSNGVYQSFKPIAKVLVQRESGFGHQSEIVSLLKSVRRQYLTAARRANALGVSQWESQIVHCDWHPGNVLFHQKHVVAVLDYDAARLEPRVLDIANGCLQFSMVMGGRDLATWEDRIDELRAKRFLRGYDEVRPISTAELQALPSLMQEALVAQAVGPILRTGMFAGLDGFEFMNVIHGKIDYLEAHQSWLRLDEPESNAMLAS